MDLIDIAIAKTLAEGGGGGGASSWGDVSGKPFETIGSGLTVTEGALSAKVEDSDVDSGNATSGKVLTADGQGGASWQPAGGGAGGADWEAQESEAGFIENKPFDVETVETVLSDYTLWYSDEFSTEMGHPFYGTFDDAAPIQNLTSPTTISVYYNDIKVDETIIDFSGILVSQSYANYMIEGNYENPVIALVNQGGAWIFAIIDDNLPSQEGSSITASINKASVTRLDADKINLAPSLLSDNGKLTINTSATYSGAGTGGTTITGGLGTAQNDSVGLSLGEGLMLNEDEAILHRVNDLFTDYVYDANTSTSFGHTTYICELPSSSYSSFPKLGLALCGIQFGIYYNDTIYKTSPMCIVGNNSFVSENLLNFYTKGTPLQSPSLEFIDSASDMGIIMYIINDDLPAEEGATLHTSTSYPYNTGYSAVDLMPATQTTLGGVKVGSGLTIDNDGVLSADGGSGDLPVATESVLGAVKVGTGLHMDSNNKLSFNDVRWALLPKKTTQTGINIYNQSVFNSTVSTMYPADISTYQNAFELKNARFIVKEETVSFEALSGGSQVKSVNVDVSEWINVWMNANNNNPPSENDYFTIKYDSANAQWNFIDSSNGSLSSGVASIYVIANTVDFNTNTVAAIVTDGTVLNEDEFKFTYNTEYVQYIAYNVPWNISGTRVSNDEILPDILKFNAQPELRQFRHGRVNKYGDRYAAMPHKYITITLTANKSYNQDDYVMDFNITGDDRGISGPTKCINAMASSIVTYDVEIFGKCVFPQQS